MGDFRAANICVRSSAFNQSCDRFSQSECQSKQGCTRKPSSSSTTIGYKCIIQDGQPAIAADCDPTWQKPSCGSSEEASSNITISVKLLPNTNPRNKCHESRNYQVTINNPHGKQLKISTITSITNGYGGAIYDQQDYNNSNMSNTSHQFIVKTGYSGDV